MLVQFNVFACMWYWSLQKCPQNRFYNDPELLPVLKEVTKIGEKYSMFIDLFPLFLMFVNKRTHNKS